MSTYPLGATWDGRGVNFALFSEHASSVELCLFEPVNAHADANTDSHVQSQRVRLTMQADYAWQAYLPTVRPGQLYGYRVDGPDEPERGHRFNRETILVDPYAKAITRTNSSFAPLAVVVDPSFDWGDDRPPRTPWNETIIYEAHVKGLTHLHPQIPSHSRGTYSAMAMPPVIDHFRRLGVTAVELMPIHQHSRERHLAGRGQSNYWGYNTLGFFAPDARYASSSAVGDAVREFKMMVRSLHAAGIEVILDVVYNHTAEGDHRGPTLSMRGIDNQVYYRLSTEDLREYVDFTGCGNTLNTPHPRVRQLIMDSLRYWVREMHVDGFRFDLASALTRDHNEVNVLGAFLEGIHQDPVISQVKLIAEPWDMGPGGYQVGQFPALWSEWNGRYRDTVRRFWRGDEGTVPELATRLAGSADLYAHNGRGPHASINFVTSHDGFTLNDLVTYNDKHNEANGEGNADGERHNISWNCGVEGPTDDPAIKALRARQKRNFIATLFLSQGVPMLSGGDEIGRTQLGNNNAYCQDNELSWHHWDFDEDERAFFDFTCRAIRIMKEHPVLRRLSFFQDERLPASGEKDITWLSPGGREMTDAEWTTGHAKCLGAVLANADVGEALVYLLNADASDVDFHLPAAGLGRGWECLLDTADPSGHGRVWAADAPYILTSRSAAVFVNKARPAGRTHRATTGQATER